MYCHTPKALYNHVGGGGSLLKTNILCWNTQTVNLTRDGGCACAVIEYRQLAEHVPRLDGAQLLPSFSNLHQPLCTQHTQTNTTTLSLRMRWMCVGEPLILLFSKDALNWWKMTAEKVIKDLYYK